jgi:hypothetical protein
MLASADRRAKNIGIAAIAVAELKLRDVQRQIFATYSVVASHDTALNQRLEALNRIGVNRADYVLSGPMVYGTVRIFAAKMVIDLISVSAKQADFFGNGFLHEFIDRRAVDTQHDARNDIAFALHGTDDGRFVLVVAATSRATTLVPVAVFILAADIGFVHFNDAAKLIDVLDKCGSDFVAHEPGGFVGTKAHIAHDLQGTHALFGSQHQMRDFKPVAQRLICVLENCSGDMREPITGIGGALIALPTPRPVRQLVRIDRAAARAPDAIGPAASYEVSAASFFIRKHVIELGGGQLVNWLWSAGHRNISPCRGKILPCPI